MFLYGQGPRGVREDEPWFDEAAADAFDASPEFWHEIPDDPRLFDPANISRFGLAAEGLRSGLDDGVLAELERAAQAVGLDLATLDGCRPWLAAQLLDSALRSTVPDSSFDVEGVLTERARAAGKDVRSEFEDAEAVLSTFAGLGRAEVEYLSWMSQRVVAGASGMRRQAEAWLRGDLSVFEEEVAEIAERWPRFYETLWRARNHGWPPRVEAMLDGGHDVFVVMGIGHLVYDDGVIDLLRRRGLPVERIH